MFWKSPIEAQAADIYFRKKLPTIFCITFTSEGAAPYQLGNTSSRTITEVKQRCAQLVLGWETVQVLSECCC